MVGGQYHPAKYARTMMPAWLCLTIEDVHQIAVEGVLVRQDGEAGDDGAELLAACFLRESVARVSGRFRRGR